MNSLLEVIGSNSGILLLILGLFLVGLLGATFRLSAKLKQIEVKWKQLLSDTSTGNLELILKDHLQERLRLQAEMESTAERVDLLESKMSTSKRHLGIVRYDAFDDVGGSQSFAFAIYDDQGNGAVMNGLVGRTDCRVYCKPLVAGRSDRVLSQEEEQAVEAAVSKSPKAVVTR